jgi:hypothetical protein
MRDNVRLDSRTLPLPFFPIGGGCPALYRPCVCSSSPLSPSHGASPHLLCHDVVPPKATTTGGVMPQIGCHAESEVIVMGRLSPLMPTPPPAAICFLEEVHIRQLCSPACTPWYSSFSLLILTSIFLHLPFLLFRVRICDLLHSTANF